MNNAWNVQFVKDDRTVIRVFEGDSPKASGAIDFAQKLKVKGIPFDIISRRRGFPPPLKLQDPPSPGMIWCPYCMKWRDYEESSVIRDGIEGPTLLRCPVCTISVMDGRVRIYNPIMTERYFISKEMKRSGNPPVHVRKRRVRR